MTASTHLLVGAAAGVLAQSFLPSGSNIVERTVISFGAGFLSHIFLDAFPHQEYAFGGIKLGLILFVEIIAVFILCLSFSNSLLTNAVIFLGMTGGALPDMIHLSHRYIASQPWLERIGAKIHFCHGVVPLGFEVNFYIQLFIALMAMIFVKSRPA